MQRVRNKGITQGITKDDVIPNHVIPDILCDVIPDAQPIVAKLISHVKPHVFKLSWMATEASAKKVLIAQNKMQIYYASQHGSY